VFFNLILVYSARSLGALQVILQSSQVKRTPQNAINELLSVGGCRFRAYGKAGIRNPEPEPETETEPEPEPKK